MELWREPMRWRWFTQCGGAVGVALALLGCAYKGPSQDEPVQRRFTWFSYLNGDDLRERCVSGAPSAYRFVYNGIYIQQVRTYDISLDATGQRGDLRARVLSPAQLASVPIRPQLSTLYEDLTAPWRGTTASVPLTDADLKALDLALAESKIDQPAPAGLRLHGEDFFWIVGACVAGNFHFNAYKWDSSAFAAITFPRLLLGWDQTGVPFNPPRSLSPFDIWGHTAPESGDGPRFSMTVGDNGLAGVAPIF